MLSLPGVNRTNNNQLPRAGRVNPAAFTMENFEDIKEGGIYDVRIVVEQKRAHALLACALSDAGETNKPRFVFHERTVSDFRQATPQNGTKNTETAPKYDPCRKFRKGDRVRLREYNGRKPYDFWHKQTIKHFGAKLDTVLDDEKEDSGHVDIFQDAPIDELTVRVHASYLELVTPVEELEPFYVCENTESKSFEVRSKEDHKVQAAFYYFNNDNATAKSAAAKATLEHCDRLNAEHRKEQPQ